MLKYYFKGGALPTRSEISHYYAAVLWTSIFVDTGVRFEEHIKDKENYYGYILEPLPDIHLNTHVNDNLAIKGNPVAIFAFLTIAVFILIIACINIMNLSIVRFCHRTREIGLRKVLGSSKVLCYVQKKC
jgi:putative ABC transport system permease protein